MKKETVYSGSNYRIEMLPRYKNALFEQRESGMTHSSFALEYALYHAIQAGDEDSLMQTISDYFNHGFIIGRMSLNEARQWKYWAVSVVAIAIHYAILGGLDETDAYNLSDAYIQTLDSLSSMQEALSYLQEKALELVRAVHAVRSKNALSPKIRKCVHYIHVHLHEKITIHTLSSYVGLSDDYLSVLFKKETGTSVHSYILDKRLQAALPMLKEGLPCEQVAYHLAFCSQSHFISCFREKYGMTPARYLRQLE